MGSADTQLIVLGRVSGLFGVRGWVKIHSHTDPREAILDYTDWQVEVDGHWQPRAVAEGRPHGKTVVVRFEGIEDRDAAAEFVGASIAVSREELPDTEEGEYYWSDLVGLKVVHVDGKELGKVAYLLETGANDVLVVKDGDRETLIPFLSGQVIKDVDLARGQISVDWEWD